MIQRIQSVFLLLAVILIGIALFSPLGYFIGSDGFTFAELDNKGLLLKESRTLLISSGALFVVLLVAGVVDLIALFSYRKRMIQMRRTNLSTILLILYYISFAGFVIYYSESYEVSFKITFYSALPVVALILNMIAYKRIHHDELLVRSADRLR